MKRFFALLLSALMLLGILASCGEQPKEQPASSELPGTTSEESGTDPTTEPKTESETEPASTEEPATSKHETEYVAPEDGSFTICGIPLSEYTEVVYLPAREELSFVNPADYKNKFLEITESAIGTELEIKIAKNEKMFTEKRYEHEILFGTGFVRDGIPEPDLSKTYYGVTADGTIYFCSPSVSVYSYLWELFLEEFCGVPLKSGQRSAGCAVSECYRELPNFTAERAEALGYSQVFSDEFDGEELDLSVWKIKHEGDMGGYFETASQDFLRRGSDSARRMAGRRPLRRGLVYGRHRADSGICARILRIADSVQQVQRPQRRFLVCLLDSGPESLQRRNFSGRNRTGRSGDRHHGEFRSRSSHQLRLLRLGRRMGRAPDGFRRRTESGQPLR